MFAELNVSAHEVDVPAARADAAMDDTYRAPGLRYLGHCEGWALFARLLIFATRNNRRNNSPQLSAPREGSGEGT